MSICNYKLDVKHDYNRDTCHAFTREIETLINEEIK